MVKFSLFFSLALLSAAAFAGTAWDEQTLQEAKTQAAADIDQYLQEHTGSIATYIDRPVAEMIEQAQYSLRNHKQLNFMTNPLPVIEALSKLSPDTKQRVGLQYLAISFAENKIERLYDLYADMIAQDKGNLPFALSELKKISSQFDSTLEKRYRNLSGQYRFNLDNIEVHRTRKSPEICLQFSDNVLPAPAQSWQDYIHFDPETALYPEYQNNQLCYQGKWQTQYRVNIDKHLLSQYRLPLSAGAQSQTINTGLPQFKQRFTGCMQVPLQPVKQAQVTYRQAPLLPRYHLPEPSAVAADTQVTDLDYDISRFFQPVILSCPFKQQGSRPLPYH